jgi:hypothetical protein
MGNSSSLTELAPVQGCAYSALFPLWGDKLRLLYGSDHMQGMLVVLQIRTDHTQSSTMWLCRTQTHDHYNANWLATTAVVERVLFETSRHFTLKKEPTRAGAVIQYNFKGNPFWRRTTRQTHHGTQVWLAVFSAGKKVK